MVKTFEVLWELLMNIDFIVLAAALGEYVNGCYAVIDTLTDPPVFKYCHHRHFSKQTEHVLIKPN